MKQFERM